MEIKGFCRIISAAWVGCLSRRSLVLGTTWHPLSAYYRPPAPHILPMVPASPGDSMDTTGPVGPMISPYHPKTVGKRQCHRARRPMRWRPFARGSHDDGHPRPVRRHAQAKSAHVGQCFSLHIFGGGYRLSDRSSRWIPVSNGTHRDAQEMTTIRSGVARAKVGGSATASRRSPQSASFISNRSAFRRSRSPIPGEACRRFRQG